MIRPLLLFCMFFVLIGCEKKVKSSDFMAQIDLVMKKDDSIQTFYTTNGTIDFNEKQSFWTKVKGSAKNQQIRLVFPDTVVPNQVRIDFGRNKQQDDIVFNKIEFMYKGNSFEAKGRDVYRYFWTDTSYAVLDKDFGLLKRKVKGQLNGPSLYPSGNFLKEKLEELTSNKNIKK